MAKYKKRVTLHPLKEDGTMDLETNLYPKTFLDGIVDRYGTEVDVATKDYVDTNKGTKLYRHKISFTDDYHELNIDLNIVSTNGDVS